MMLTVDLVQKIYARHLNVVKDLVLLEDDAHISLSALDRHRYWHSASAKHDHNYLQFNDGLA